MTARTEPSVGLFNGMFTSKQSAKSHESIMTEALQGFTQAAANLDAAHATINEQIVADQEAIAALATKIGEANESLSRLARVRGRISDLIA